MAAALGRWLMAQGQRPTGAAGWLVAAGEGAVFVPVNAQMARLAGIRDEDRVLDVACGAGFFLRAHAGRAAYAAGLDHSELQVAAARRLLRRRLRGGSGEVVCGDATQLPWPDESFTVVCCNCLDCFGGSKPQQALAEMRRVLRPGGRLVVGVARVDEPEQVRRIEQEAVLNAFTGADLSAALGRAGLVDVRVSERGGQRFAAARRPTGGTADNRTGTSRMRSGRSGAGLQGE